MKYNWERIKPIIPNLFTTLSLLSGLVALGFINQEKVVTSCWLIALAIILDGLDGKIARYLKVSSPFGAMYDTLSDFVTFGVLPAYISYSLLPVKSNFFVLIPIIYVLTGAYRLVRFSLQQTQDDMGSKKAFTGLPIPAAAGMITSFIIMNYQLWNYLKLLNIHLLIMFVFSLLMISRIEYNPVQISKRTIKYLFLILLVVVLIAVFFFRFHSLIYIGLISFYAVTGIIRHFVIKIIKS